MPLKVIEETIDREVGMLSDVNVNFVSLVRHGANQQPFRVVKGEKKKEEIMDLAIQSVYVPENVKFDTIAKEFNLKPSDDTSVSCGIAVHTFFPIDEVEKGSEKIVSIQNVGSAIVGKLKKNSKVIGSVSFLSKDNYPDMSSVTLARTEKDDTYIEDSLWDELYKIEDLFRSILTQKNITTDMRKTILLQSLDAFKNFTSARLDLMDRIAVDATKIARITSDELDKARWAVSYINELPDGAFAVIEPGYVSGETQDKNARHLPHHTADVLGSVSSKGIVSGNSNNTVDPSHYKNAKARANQIKPITTTITTEDLREKAIAHLEKHAKAQSGEKKEELTMPTNTDALIELVKTAVKNVISEAKAEKDASGSKKSENNQQEAMAHEVIAKLEKAVKVLSDDVKKMKEEFDNTLLTNAASSSDFVSGHPQQRAGHQSIFSGLLTKK